MQDFHSIKSPITLAFGQENLSKASFANNLQEVKVCWLGIWVSRRSKIDVISWCRRLGTAV